MLLLGQWQLSRADEKITLDNRIHKGVAGYEVLTPLLLSDKKLSTELALSEQPVVLVNRGWVAAESYRTVLPDIAMQLAVDDVSVEGLLTTPSKGFARGDALSPQQQDTQQQSNGQGRDWPQVLQFVDYAAIADALGTAVIAGVVQGYGYAFQWFAMFIALCVIFIVTNLKNKDQTIAGHEKS